ncbi:MAG: hypothetical protein ACK40M_09550 [Flavobacteriales bacterium]
MDAKQHLYYGLGLIAYAVAGIDGKVQREERETIQRLLSEGIKKVDVDYDVADIIFQIVEKEKADFETAYNWGIDAFKLGSHHLTPGMKWVFLDILQSVSDAFPDAAMVEGELIARFARDLRAIGS